MSQFISNSFCLLVLKMLKACTLAGLVTANFRECPGEAIKIIRDDDASLERGEDVVCALAYIKTT